MKTKFCLLIISVLATFAACTKTKITPLEPDTPEIAIARSAIDKTAELLVDGSWHIASYTRNNTDKTDLFRGYELRFAPNGNVIDARNPQSQLGKWVIAYVDGICRLSIRFSVPASFIEANGDWTLTEENGKQIKLKDALRPADVLIMEKN